MQHTHIVAARDLREGGRWSLGQRWKNDVIFAVVRAAIVMTRPLPVAVLRAIGRAIGALAYALLPGTRAVADENVARAFPDMDRRARASLLRRAYRALGHELGEAASALRGDAVAPLPFDPASRAVLAEAMAEGNGCIFVSAHLGPWERVAGTLVHEGFALTTIARESYDPRLTEVYDRLRGGAGVRTIYRGDPHAPVRIVRTLRRGGLLGVPMDLRSRVPSIDVPFLGHDAPTPVGPARLALRIGAAVVVGTVAKGAAPRPHALTVTRVTTSDLTAGNAGERALTERLNDELSQRIRACAEEWVWMHARWRREREGQLRS